MIIVTGATGFIGSNLVAELNDRGRSDIVIVDDLGDGTKWRNIAQRQFIDLVFPSELEGLLSKLSKADVVFHLGANSSTTATNGDEIVKSNLRPSMLLWNWCSRTRSRFVYASSAATYGDGSRGFDDDEAPERLAALRPLNLYGWSKHAFDRWALAQANGGTAPVHWAGLKFFNVYGPNEYHKGDMQSLVAKNARIVHDGGAVTLFKSHREGYADGAQLRDFVYVDDCVRVMLWLAGSTAPNGLYNLGTGVARTFHDLVLAIGKALNTEVRIDFREMPMSIRENYQYFTQANISKLRKAGYNERFHSLEEGVSAYVGRYLTTSNYEYR